MVRLENSHWQEIEHNCFALPYAGYLVVHPLSQEPFSELDQELAATALTETARTHIRRVELASDDLDRAHFTVRLEAESDVDALRLLSVSALEAWASCGKDPDDLELVAIHLAYEPELPDIAADELTLVISDPDYTAERLELLQFDEITDELRPVEPREIFYKARAASSE